MSRERDTRKPINDSGSLQQSAPTIDRRRFLIGVAGALAAPSVLLDACFAHSPEHRVYPDYQALKLAVNKYMVPSPNLGELLAIFDGSSQPRGNIGVSKSSDVPPINPGASSSLSYLNDRRYVFTPDSDSLFKALTVEIIAPVPNQDPFRRVDIIVDGVGDLNTTEQREASTSHWFKEPRQLKTSPWVKEGANMSRIFTDKKTGDTFGEIVTPYGELHFFVFSGHNSQTSSIPTFFVPELSSTPTTVPFALTPRTTIA